MIPQDYKQTFTKKKPQKKKKVFLKTCLKCCRSEVALLVEKVQSKNNFDALSINVFCSDVERMIKPTDFNLLNMLN